MRTLLVLVALLVGGSALARKPQEFIAPREMTQQELEAAKTRSKNNINSYDQDIPQETRPFPWGAVAFMGFAVLVATPFALRMYANTARELEGNATFGANRPSADDE